MKEITISNFEEYHKFVNTSSSDLYLFRGVSNSTFKLLPSIARKEDSNYEKTEHDLIWLFKSFSFPHIDKIPQNDWDWLCLAQHYRLPTRLLDWTKNPLVALYFSVLNNFDDDGAVYVMRLPYFITPEEQKAISPFSINHVRFLLPIHYSQRISAQDGFLSIHPDPFIPYEDEKIEKLVIPKINKEEFIITLDQYSINKMKLFPDLEGIASHLRWLKGYA